MPKAFINVFVLAALLLGTFALPSSAATKKTPAKTTVKKVVKPAPPKKPIVYVVRKLDGLYVAKGTENFWPIAVMIDNHTAARPQSGLQNASLVYETLAEGGIPRFMAVYADKNVKEVGPVRSTRPYFVREAAEINAALAHAGGSPDGLKLLTKLRMPNFEGLKAFAKYFYRARGGGVHGMYTTMAKMYDAVGRSKLAKVKPLYRNWLFTDGVALSQRPNGKHGATIDLGYGKSYAIEYRYDKKLNAFLRFTGGRAHIDRASKKQISVRNLVIMNVPKVKVLDKKGRLDINVIGKGTGWVLKNGQKTQIKWSKASDRARTIFTETNGKEIVFNRGNTWVTIVPQGRKYKVY